MRKRGRAHGRASKKLAAAWLFSRAGEWNNADYQCGHCERRKLYQRRNCRKHPEFIQIDRRPCWTPKTKTGGTEIAGYRITECPTSYITGESIWLLGLLGADGVIHREAGATMFGAESRKWPAWWMDAVMAIASVSGDWDRAETSVRK